MSSSCVACLYIGVGELGAGGLLGSMSAGVGDGGGGCCCWFAVMVASQRRCHVLVDVTCRHNIDVAGPRTLLSRHLVRAKSLVTAQLSEVQRTPCSTVG